MAKNDKEFFTPNAVGTITKFNEFTYTVDDEQFPTEIKFSNGMIVRVKHVDARLYLEIGKE